MLPSGTVIDTAAPDAEERFADAEPELAAGLLEIRDEIRADAELTERIRRKFEIKNTTGYRLCAFLDADKPLEIFRRLLVGSEGTLAFIAEAVVRDRAAAAADDASPGSTSPTSTPRPRRCAELVAAGRPRGRADGRAGADRRRATTSPARPSTGRSSPRTRRRCWSSSAPTTTAELDAAEARGRRGARRRAS